MKRCSLKNEDAKRLRACLEALSEACGHDVFRLETIADERGIRIVLTCSRKTAEMDVGKILAVELKRMMGNVEMEDSKAEDVSGG
jgi:hypothetical protein